MPYSGSTIDEQVVKMSFDNSNFDSNINSSINILNSLDNRLNTLSNANSISKIATNLESLSKVFTVKGQIMLGVFTSLGQEIVKVGKNIKNYLFKGIKDGFGEYKTIIDSTEAIYQNVKQNGNSLQDVNNALDELNDYADKTIYNFGQMTRMIGMFSSAGVGLKSSVSTIKGLSNAAALVGANMQKAQIGWNAVSRAMSSGKFTNMTWRSLELSGIAGKQFNKVITEVARNMHIKGKKSGKDIDGMIKKYGSLRESLQEGWLDKKVFTEAMDIMSGAMSKADLKKKGYTDKQIKELRAIAEAAEEAATKVKTFQQLMDTIGEAIGSGWAQSFRILLGDLDQAKELYTRISNVIGDFIDNNANIRNELFHKIMNEKDNFNIIVRDFTTGQVAEITKGWETGRENFTRIIENMMAIVKTFLKSVKTGFLNIFPVDRIAAGARKVLSIVQQFTKALVLNNEELNSKDEVLGWDTKNIDKISDAIKDLIKFFRGLASAVDIAWMAISQPAKEIMLRIPFFTNFFENIHKGVVGFTAQLGKIGDKITVVRDAAKEFNIFGAATEYLFDNFDNLVKKSPVLQLITKIFNSIKDSISGLNKSVKSIEIKPLTTLFGIFKMVVVSLWNVLNKVVGLLSNIAVKVDWSWLDKPKEAITNVLKIFDDYGKGIITFKEATGKIKDFFIPIFSNIQDFIKKIPFKKIFGNLFGGLKTVFSSIANIVKKYFGNGGKALKVTENATTTFSSINGQLIKADSIIGSISNTVGTTTDKVKQLLNPVDTIESATDDINDKVEKTGSLFEKISGIFGNLNKIFDTAAKKIAIIGTGLGAGALGIALLAKRIEKIKILSNVNNVLDAGVDVIKAYQKNIQSKTIMNIAIAIGILAASMLTLALIPYDKLENGLTIFVGFMGTLALTIPPVIDAMARLSSTFRSPIPTNQFDMMQGVLNNLINSTKKFAMKVSKGLNARMIGKAFKDIAISVLILAGAMIALKFAFKKPEEIILPIQVILGMLIAMTTAVAVLTGIIESFNKTLKDLRPSVGIFSSFFKLAGVSKIIISMALAMLALSGALVIISKIDTTKLLISTGVFLVVFGALGGIAALLTSIGKNANNSKVKVVVTSMALVLASVALIAAALSKVDSPEKLAGVIIGIGTIFASFGGIMLIIGHLHPPSNLNVINGVIATLTGSLIATTIAIGGLIYVINKSGNKNSWWQSLTSLSTMLILFGGTIAGLMVLANRIKNINIWTKLQTTIAMASGAILAMAGSIALISNVKAVPPSTLAIFGTIALVIESILAVAIIMSSVRGGLLTPAFSRTMITISASIAALATSIGIMSAGIAAVSLAINKIDISSKNVSKVSNNIIDRLSSIGTMIITALPALNEIFTKIGFAVANIFTSFLKSFIDSIANMGDEYVMIADKITNLIIDLVSKVVDSLYERKDEIALVVMKAVAVIVAVVKSVIDSIFHTEKLDSMISLGGKLEIDASKFSLVAKIIGSIGLILLAARTIPILIKSFNVIYSAIKGITKLIFNVLSPVIHTVYIQAHGSIVATIADLAALAVAIAATVVVLNQASHAWKQFKGEEEAYHNASINSLEEAGANLTNMNFLLQATKYGVVTLGRMMVEAFLDIGRAIRITGDVVAQFFLAPFEFLNNLITTVSSKIVGFFSPELAAKIEKFGEKINAPMRWLRGDVAEMGANMAEGFENITNYELGSNGWTMGNNWGKNVVEGSVDGLSNYSDSINDVLAKGDSEIQDGVKLRWDINSPSKVMRALYSSLPEGAQAGVESGMSAFQEYVSDANDQLAGEMASGVAKQEYAIKKGSKGIEKALEQTSNIYASSANKTNNEMEQASREFEKSFNEAIGYEEKVIKNGKKKIQKASEIEAKVQVSALGGIEATKAANQSTTKQVKDSSSSEKYTKLKQETADIASYINALRNSVSNDANGITNSVAEIVNSSALVLEKATVLRDTKVKAYSADEGIWKEINLNTRMIDIMEEQKTALVGKSKAEAAVYLQRIAEEQGIVNAKEESYKLVNALWSNQIGQEELTLKSINRLSEATSASLEQYIGESGAANALVLNNYLTSSDEMLKLAEEHSNELVGLNKKQAKEKLYEEARARGMSEEDAKIHSEALTKLMFAQKKGMKKLNKDAIIAGIKMGEEEEKAYKEKLEHETYLLQQALEERLKKEEYASKMMANGKFDVSTFRSYMDDVKKAYKDQVDKYNKTVKEIEKELEKKGRIDDKTWKKQWDEAVNTINKQKSKKRGTFMGALDSFKKTVKDGLSGALNLNPWNNNFKFPTSDNKNKDKNDAVNAAKDTKKALEAQRADLTPTFDLDKLSDEAKKANGIVMSSLMAAQNASIADYINTDSELNPFMKDRWQNVYNFTQNNYSPKALSRTDIYRQTQRQLKLSRGF